MAQYDGLFRPVADRSQSAERKVAEEVDKFLSALTKAQSNVSYYKEPDRGQGGASWKVAFHNNKGLPMGAVLLGEADADKDGKPDFVVMPYTDVRGGEMALSQQTFDRIFEKGIADNLEAWQHIPTGHGKNVHIISGIQSFEDVQPQSLASFLMQISDEVHEARAELRVTRTDPNSGQRLTA